MPQSRAFKSIPLINLAPTEQNVSREEFLQQLRHALQNIGFLYVENHGVPEEVISDIVDLLPTLFGLTEDEKSQIELENSPHFLGYSSVGSETTAGKQDQREQFEFATELEETWNLDQPLFERLKGPNQWPKSLPIAQSIVERYIAELTSLSSRFLKLVAEALDLNPDTFHAFLSDQHRLKIVHYPAGATNAQGVGPHKDSSGWWTFLLQASPDVRGLQALNKDGDWIDVPNIPGTFVVNIGQAFEVVTHGACKATTHRVLGGEAERYSIPFFQGVRRDLTKEEALNTLAHHFKQQGKESNEGAQIDSAFLTGNYDTWGEAQLRTKIRSHHKAGKRFYGEVFDRYVNDQS